MKRCALIFLLAQTARLSAQNVTVTFQPAALPGGVATVSQWVEQGMRFSTPSGLASNDASNALYPNHGNAYIQALSGWSPLTITSVSLQPFTLISVDLAEYSTTFAVPKSITFLGTLFGGGTVSTTFVTDGLIDGNGAGSDFETFFFPASFTNLTQVTVNTDTYSLDNLSVAVPEPSALTFILLALIPAIVFAARRAKAEIP